jgi:hypothetical protein
MRLENGERANTRISSFFVLGSRDQTNLRLSVEDSREADTLVTGCSGVQVLSMTCGFKLLPFYKSRGTTMSDELTKDEALLLLDALTFNGYVSDDTGNNRRLYLMFPHTDWLPTELAQKFSRISEKRKAEARLESQKAEFKEIQLAAKRRENWSL